MKLASHKFIIISGLFILTVTLYPTDGKVAGQYLDKVVHFVIFFLLGLSISHEVRPVGRRTSFLLGGIMFAFFTEIAQQYIPGRNLDFYDVLADTLGIVTAFMVTSWLYKNKG